MTRLSALLDQELSQTRLSDVLNEALSRPEPSPRRSTAEEIEQDLGSKGAIEPAPYFGMGPKMTPEQMRDGYGQAEQLLKHAGNSALQFAKQASDTPIGFNTRTGTVNPLMQMAVDAIPERQPFEVEPPKDILDKGTEVLGGLAGTVANLLVGRGALPSAVSKVGNVVRNVLAWEFQNWNAGGFPGKGAAIGGVLEGINAIPAKTLTEKAGKLAGESAFMYKLAEAEGAPREDRWIQAGVPVALKVIGWHGNAEDLIARDPKLADKIIADKTASRKEMLRAGITEETSKPDRALFSKVVEETKRQNEEFTKTETLQKAATGAPEATEPVTPEQAAQFDQFKPPPEASGAGATPAPEAQRLTTVSREAAGITPAETMPDIADAWSSVRGIARRYLTSRGNMPQEVFDAWIRSRGEKAESEARIEQSLRDLKRAAKEELGSSKLSDESIRVVDQALRSTEPSPSLGPKMQGAVTKMRNQIDALSNELIESGAADAKMAETIQAGKGEYLHRSYRVFDDPNWSKKVSKETREYAEAFLREEMPDYTPEEVSAYVDGLLYEGKAAESAVAFMYGRKVGQKDLSILKERFLPEPLRKLYGEYEDPAINFARSSTKISHLISNHRFLTSVRESGLGKFLFEKRTVNENGRFIAEIADESDPTMKPLWGLFTTPEIKSAFDRQFSQQSYPTWLTAYMRVNGAVKTAKTVLSAMTGVRNFVSNYGIALANGNFHVSKIGSALRTVMADLGIKDSAQWRAKVLETRRYGVLGDSARSGELKQLGKDTFRGEVSKNLMKLPTRAYGAEDDFWKVYGWENEQIKYRKAYPEWTDAQLKAHAAQIIRNTHPTYAMVPEFTRNLRQFPLVGTFVSWPSEILRTGYHILELTGRELQDPRTRAIGVQRLIGMLAAASIGDIVAGASRSYWGITSSGDEDFRQFVPDWSKNSNILYVGRDKNHPEQVRYVDMGFSDAWAVLKKPIMAFMRGEDWQKSLTDAVTQMAEPFVGEEILAGKLVDIARNVTQQGKQIYNPQSDWLTQNTQKLAHIWEALEPGTVTQIKRIKAGLEGRVGTTGKSYDPRVEALAMSTGQRISEVNVPQAMQFRAMQFHRQMADAQRVLNSVLTRRGTVTAQEIDTAYEQAEVSRKKLFDGIQRTISAARRLGMNERQIAEALDNSGISKKQRKELVAGTYVPYMPSKQFEKNMAKTGSVPDIKQRMKTARQRPQ